MRQISKVPFNEGLTLSLNLEKCEPFHWKMRPTLICKARSCRPQRTLVSNTGGTSLVDVKVKRSAIRNKIPKEMRAWASLKV